MIKTNPKSNQNQTTQKKNVTSSSKFSCLSEITSKKTTLQQGKNGRAVI